MANKVNIEAVSAALGDVLKKADEFNVKKRSIVENIKELEAAIPLFERLVALYESVPEDSPRAKTYMRLAQQIAAQNDGGPQAGYSDLRAEAKLADAENARDRLSEAEAAAVGKFVRSSKLSEFVREFDIENLERFRQFKALLSAVTDMGPGLPRKLAQTRRVANVREVLRDYGTSSGDGAPVAAEDGAPQFRYHGGKWYKRQPGMETWEDIDKAWEQASAATAAANMSPTAYAAERARGEREAKAVASIEKTSRYIADLEPAGGRKKKEKKAKNKKRRDPNQQGWGEALLQLAKWAGYGLATLGAIAGAAALIPKLAARFKKWQETNAGAKAGNAKFNEYATNKTAEGVKDVGAAAAAYDADRAFNQKVYEEFVYTKIQGDPVATYLAGNEDVYGSETLHRTLSLAGPTRNKMFEADILRAYNRFKETGDAEFTSAANEEGRATRYHLWQFQDNLPELTAENKAGLQKDWEAFKIRRGLQHINARRGWDPTLRTLGQQTAGIGLGFLGAWGGASIAGGIGGLAGAAAGYTAGVGGVAGVEAARSPIRGGMSQAAYEALSPQAQAEMALKRQADRFATPAMQTRDGLWPALDDSRGALDLIPREMLGELVMTRGWVERTFSRNKVLLNAFQKARALNEARQEDRISQAALEKQMYEVAGVITEAWDARLRKMGDKYYNENKKYQPSQQQLADELLWYDDFREGGNILDNMPANEGGRPSHYQNVVAPTYVNQTTVVSDENAQRVGGKQ